MTDNENLPARGTVSEEDMISLTYEEAIARLEQVVKQLETGDIPLDDSLQLFQKGMKLSSICHHKLDEIEKKITQLVEQGNGETGEIPFGEDNG